jgi:5'-nucleotidase
MRQENDPDRFLLHRYSRDLNRDHCLDSTIYCDAVSIEGEEPPEYRCSGTPADCVKMAISEIMQQKPDLCVSGINHGSNSSINVIYSGTMSAAIEAGIEGVPAIGFSLLDYDFNADFEPLRDHVRSIAASVLEKGLPEGVVLNVNFPKMDGEPFKGVRVCRQAKANWVEEFDQRINPQGKKYYWLTGKFVNLDHGEDTDLWALENGYVSVVPVQFDLTAHHALQSLNSWDL